MNKMMLLLLALVSCVAVQAQVKLPGNVAGNKAANFVQPPALGDIGKATTGIVSELAGKLALGEKEKPQLTDAIGSFLGKKKDIMGLAGSNPSTYLSQFNPLQQNLFGKMKNILGAAKFAKFLGLKPAKAIGPLSNLFF